MASPLEQFVVKPIVDIQAGSANLSFTNSSLFRAFNDEVVPQLMLAGMRHRA